MEQRLNKREEELLAVARDLFLKGSPEWRVAKYAFDQKFTEQQLINFLEKIIILESNTRLSICNHYRDMNREQGCYDHAKNIGEKLKSWLKSYLKRKA